jgi:hypothetical protein
VSRENPKQPRSTHQDGQSDGSQESPYNTQYDFPSAHARLQSLILGPVLKLVKKAITIPLGIAVAEPAPYSS